MFTKKSRKRYEREIGPIVRRLFTNVKTTFTLHTGSSAVAILILKIAQFDPLSVSRATIARSAMHRATIARFVAR